MTPFAFWTDLDIKNLMCGTDLRLAMCWSSSLRWVRRLWTVKWGVGGPARARRVRVSVRGCEGESCHTCYVHNALILLEGLQPGHLQTAKGGSGMMLCHPTTRWLTHLPPRFLLHGSLEREPPPGTHGKAARFKI